MSDIDVFPVRDGRLRRRFINLPYSLYASDPHWVPPLRRDEHRRLSASHNPFLQHASIDCWIAQSGGRDVGRIAAIDDRLYRDRHGDGGWFGFFEAENEAAARALFAAMERHHRGEGRTFVVGPANPSLNESGGLLVQGFDEDPYALMPFNPPHYAGFIEAAGYRKAKDLLAWHIDLSVAPPERVVRIAERASRRHEIRIRPVDLRHFDRDLALLQTIYRDAWTDNWGFVPPTEAEIRQLAIDLRPILDPNLVLFAERGEQTVACSVAIPDVNQVLKRMGGRLFPFGLVHFLRRRRIIDQARLLLLGVLAEARHLGLYPMLIMESHRRGVAGGYRRGELSWTLEDNDAINAGIEAVGGRRYKTYRLYEKALG